MVQSHRQQLSTEEVLAGRDNEEETFRDRGTICQFLRSSSQESRKGNAEESGFVPKVQHSLRTFLNKVSLCSIVKEAVVGETAQLLNCSVRYVMDIRSFLCVRLTFRRAFFSKNSI